MKKTDTRLACVVLAAGLGTRMKSDKVKVLHEIYGKPMLQYVLDELVNLGPKKIVVVTGEAVSIIEKAIPLPRGIEFAIQKKQKGTADALLSARRHLKGFKGTVLVVNGDSPLVLTQTLGKFIKRHRKNGNVVSLISFNAEDPGAYGRVLRDGRGRPQKIVERLDASTEQLKITEVNSGVYALEPPALLLLPKIKVNKKKGEHYLTDIVELAASRGLSSGAYCMGGESEFIGVNTRDELAQAHEIMRRRSLSKCLSKGVSIIDVSSAHIEPSVTVGGDTVIYPNVYLQGDTKIGKGCTIYPNVRVVDSTVKDGAVIKDSSLIEESVVGTGASVGPFAHLRPGSTIGKSAKIGNFVEVKASSIGEGTKAMHLTYIGDAEVGKKTNIGAGTITCNYDGVRKHKTIIGDGVFVGSDTQLVAPVKVDKGSYIGAGTTVTKDVPKGHLATSRTRQKNIPFKPRAKK
jgi:bifunctional UDP-N-acetylglucosamine pyrophosphorylase/glucosamine-1-phosphate N-acetyltransferase